MSAPTVADMRAALESFASLEPGWCHGDGETFDLREMQRVASRLAHLVQQGIAVPHVYPMSDGGITAEWFVGGWDASVDVHVPDMAASFYAFNTMNETFEAAGTLGVGTWLADALRKIGAVS